MAVGDVNGDGFDDLIANARFVSEVVQAGGEVYVIPGPLAFNQAYTMPNSVAIVFQGTSGYQPQIGVYLDSGDMNGDGFDDIVMGSWTSGKAHVYLGSSDIQTSSPLTIAAVPENMALTLSPASDGLVLCDINGDGYQDLFIEELSWENWENGVQVWGVLGSAILTMTQPVTLTMPTNANVIIQGFYPVVWGSPNQKNMACGDIDGDNYPDLAIGIYGESPPYRHSAGIVYVIQGDPEITPSTPVTLTMPDQADAIIEGVDGRLGSSGDGLGTSLAIADIDQDGRGDLIMGAPGASGPDNLLQHAGEVYLWLGRALEGQRFIVSSQASWIVHGEESYDILGNAIVASDFDNDGFPEILLGCSSCSHGGPPLYLAGQGCLEPRYFTGLVTVTAVSELGEVPIEMQDVRLPSCMDLMVTVNDLVMSALHWIILKATYPELCMVSIQYATKFALTSQMRSIRLIADQHDQASKQCLHLTRSAALHFPVPRR
jgi:hypothetical protein